MGERAALRVLAGEAHRRGLRQERGEGQGLGRGPVERALARRHLRALLHELGELGMEVEPRRDFGLTLQEPAQRLAGHAGVGVLRLVEGTAAVRRPDRGDLGLFL
jgi:hypothetical protein